MLFGLRNAAQTFQRFIDTVLQGLHFSFAYVDDILVTSSLQEEHLQHLRLEFQRLAEHSVNINPSKCLFGKQSLNFLGHHIDCNCISPLPGKVEAITAFPQPQSQRQLREFLGMVNFYRFIPHCAELMQQLHSLLQNPLSGLGRPRRLFRPLRTPWQKRPSSPTPSRWRLHASSRMHPM